MATYLQWSKKRSVRRVTWVCGPEAVLARDVVAAHREGAPPGQCSAVFAGDVPEGEVWSLLLTSAPGGRRVTVYGAEKLKLVSRVGLLAGDDAPDTTFAVLVSGDDDFTREAGELAPYLAALQSSRHAQLVRCCAPSGTEDRVNLVASWWPGLSPVLASRLLSRTGSLDKARLACDQAVMAGLTATPATVAAVSPGEPGGDVADLLMAGSKSAAMEAARQLRGGEVGALIGLLASRLAVAEAVGEEVRAGAQPREAVRRAGVDRFVAGKVLPYLGSYGAGRIASCRRLLASADAAYRGGARLGVAESLVAAW